MNLPNKLTVGRMIAVPFFIAAYMMGYYPVALVLFCLASATDALDGSIARKRGLVTNFGKIMVHSRRNENSSSIRGKGAGCRNVREDQDCSSDGSGHSVSVRSFCSVDRQHSDHDLQCHLLGSSGNDHIFRRGIRMEEPRRIQYVGG